MKSIKEEVENMKKEVEEISKEEKSLAYEILEDTKREKKYIFKGLIAVIIILIVLLFGSNLAWLIYINQFDFTSDTVDIDSGNGMATYLEESNAGDITYNK